MALLCALVKCVLTAFPHNSERPTGYQSSRSARRPVVTDTIRGIGRAFALLATALLLTGLATSNATASYGTTIPNFATLTYDFGGPVLTADSNIVSFTVRSPATIEFLKYAPTTPGAEDVPVPPTFYDDGTGTLVLIPPPAPALQPTVPVVTGPAGGSPIYYLGETFYLRLTDLDQNLAPVLAETVTITVTCVDTADTETLQLTETGPDTGIFAGYLPAAPNGPAAIDGEIAVVDGCALQASYTDINDNTDVTVDAALVDPYGFVFDSYTGDPIDGAVVTLIDESTGQPALVYGDDGISIYQPDGTATGSATVVTGGTATDESGLIYNLPPGGFRFPYVLPGTYRLQVTAPSGYLVPSTVSDQQIAVVRPGAVITTGSRGEAFVVNPGPAVRIDIPADPLSTGLWLQKDVNRDLAEIGDFLEYTLTIENTNELVEAPDLTITDTLPLGFRYQEGSAKVDSVPSDPQVLTDGRTLIFSLGDLGPQESRAVTYVVEVAAGVSPGKAINRAIAEDAFDKRSNLATKTVVIKETFFNHTSILVGKVHEGSCSQDNSEMGGLANVRIYLEDGTYVVTDKNGRYHFEGVEPGIHVVQVDTTSLPNNYEMLPCEETSQTAGRTFSQFVDLQGGTLWRVDFYTAPKTPPSGEVTLQMSSGLEDQAGIFHVDIAAKAVPTENLRLTVMLPGKSNYQKGTTAIDQQPAEDPQAMPGVVIYRLGNLLADDKTRVTFRADLDTTAETGKLPAKALLLFDTPGAINQKTPIAETSFVLGDAGSTSTDEIKLYPHFPSFIAELQDTDRAMLAQLAEQVKGQRIARVDVVGHTDNVRIAPRSRHIFADNQALSEARAVSVARFLRDAIDIPDDIMTVRGMGKTMPVADNSSAAGRALNRRVELYLVTETETETLAASLTVDVTDSGEQSLTTSSTTDTSTMDAFSARLAEERAMLTPPNINPQWLQKHNSDVELVWPAPGYIPEIPSTEVMLKYRRGQKPQLRLNGEPVNPVNFDTTVTHPTAETVVAKWSGVDIVYGKNVIEATVVDAQGETVKTVTREFSFSTDIYNIEVLEDKSRLIADGLNAPVIAVRLTDQHGNIIRPGQYGQFEVKPPYMGQTNSKFEGSEDLNLSSNKSQYLTSIDGLAYLSLEPTTQAGEATIMLPTMEGVEEFSVWLKPAQREWILVGFAQGTVGYNDLSGNQVSLDEAGIDEHYYDDGRVKFFAKGAIKGAWLLTMAYDSDKPDLDGESLHQIIDPDDYYPLYGDATQQRYEAASARNIYIKLEKDQTYALFGDMSTDLDETVLAQYNRNLNGIKVEQQTENFSVKMFVAETEQSFAKDEIRGDGTSGRYQLSNKNLVINSDQVVIETRGRLHSEVIVRSQSLARHTDYEIDYNTGTLYFKRPVPSRDENFNPVYIVVRYEVEGSTGKNKVYGGRAAVRGFDDKVELGASYIHEERDQGEGDLYAIDSTVELSDSFELHIEVARTESEDTVNKAEGDAYLAEVVHESERTIGRAYYREQDKDFGLGQLNDSEEGMRKYGANIEHDVTSRVTVTAEAYRQDNLTTDANRDVGEVAGSYKGDGYQLRAGARHVEDKLDDGTRQQSTQALVGADWDTRVKGVKLHADFEQSLDNNNESEAYPTLLSVGADYQFNKNIRLFADQEFTWGEGNDTEATRAGIAFTPWKGGSVETSVEQQVDENSQRMFALFGLGQTWQVNDHWAIDVSLDRSQTLKSNESDSVNPKAASAHGTEEDYTAVSVGATYSREKWAWSNRLEVRDADSEVKYGATTRIVAEVKDGVAVSAKATAFVSDRKGDSDNEEAEISLGLAYRPDDSRWIILERFDFEYEHEDGYTGRRLINHIHANWHWKRKVQFSLYSGVKYVYDTIGGDTYDGVTDMHAAEVRYNATKRWDVGAFASWLHSWNNNNFDYAAGVSVGYLVRTNTWVSLGYNFKGFEDDDFSSAHYTAQGPYMRFRMKFDQESVREAAEWLNE